VIVVDANVIAYFFIEGDKTAGARDLMRRDPDWGLPALWRHEYLNVLATFVREGGATIAEAQRLWRQGIELLGSREQSVDMELALASRPRTGLARTTPSTSRSRGSFKPSASPKTSVCSRPSPSRPARYRPSLAPDPGPRCLVRQRYSRCFAAGTSREYCGPAMN